MPTQPNILFLLSDEHNHRYFSHLDPSKDGEPVHTPALDQLAENSANLQHTYCQVPLCTPSRICLLAGRSPMTSGGWDNKSMLRPDIETLPQTFADAGYETTLIGKMHLGGDRQFAGFRHRPYGDLTGATGHQWEKPFATSQTKRSRTADAGITDIPESILQEQVIVRESLAFLREHRHANPDQPWLLCASFSRPHFPLTAPRRFFERYYPDNVTPPKVGRTGDSADHPMTVGMAEGFEVDAIDEEEMMRARAAYFACVDYLDEILGDMLALLERDGLLENTIIVYTADHGEMAGEHGMWWKNSWHEGATRVPCFIQLPQHRNRDLRPITFDTPTSLADLYPTLCGLAGIDAPANLEGMDLSAAITEREEPDRAPVFCDIPLPRWGEGTENRLVRDGRFKYVAFRAVEPDLLFDLDADPLEQHNLLLSGTDVEKAVGIHLRNLVDESWDFDAAQTQYEADWAQTQSHQLPFEDYWGNLYLMPGNRLIAADTPLYDPVLLTDEPESVFADWPGDTPEDK